MEKRIYWIDYAKAFCIFLVVLGHSYLPESAKNVIYVFHIPLFFFISGTLFSFEKHPVYTSFLKKKVLQILIPYLFFNITTYIFWYFIGRKVGNDIEIGLQPQKQLIGILWGNDWNHYLEHCSPMWFLTCLFMVENLYYIIFKHISSNLKIIGIMVFVVIGYVDYKFNPIRLPWGLNVAMLMIVFYGIGSILHSSIINIKKQSSFNWLLITIVSLIGILIISILNGKVEVSIGEYQNYFLFIVGAIFGILFIFSLSNSITLYFNQIQFFQYIGKNTIIILGFHLLAGSFIKAITFYLFKFPLSIYETTSFSFLYSVMSIIILIPAMLILNKYTPFFIGKKKL